MAELVENEKRIFELVADGKEKEALNLYHGAGISAKCANKDMTLLSHACFYGLRNLVVRLLRDGADPNDPNQSFRYTPLMFAALSGKETSSEILRILMDAGAYTDTKNSIGKTAVEMAALVGHHNVVSVINSHVGLGEVERIIHPKGTDSENIFPLDFVKLTHATIRTHHIYPIKLILFLQHNPVLYMNREKYLYVIDSVFERQMRNGNANEVLSVKLWMILFILKQAISFINRNINSGKTVARLLMIYAKQLLYMKPSDVVRRRIETMLRNSIRSYPYQTSLLFRMLVKAISIAEFGSLPGTYHFIIQGLFGYQTATYAQFCATCGVPDAKKCCCVCKTKYCSISCQRFDWHIHKRCCDSFALRDIEENSNLVCEQIPVPTMIDEEENELDKSYSSAEYSFDDVCEMVTDETKVDGREVDLAAIRKELEEGINIDASSEPDLNLNDGTS